MSTDVTMTIEPAQPGYCQHMLTVDRAGMDFTEFVMLTDSELAALGPLIDQYRAAQEAAPSAIGITFTDRSGRTP